MDSSTFSSSENASTLDSATTLSSSVGTSLASVLEMTTAALAAGCESLVGKGLTLSTTSNATWTVVNVGCDQFGHRPSGGISQLVCLNTSQWEPAVPSCQWSWNLTTQEKIIFGTAVAAGSFVIIVAAAIFLAYFCCFRSRKEDDEKNLETSYQEPSPRTGYDNPSFQQRDSLPITYLAYQDVPPDKGKDNYIFTSTLDKPWLGYIPRPKVIDASYDY